MKNAGFSARLVNWKEFCTSQLEEPAMQSTDVAAFDHTLQKTNLWLREIRRELWWMESDRAYHALRAVLHALRDRLPIHEAVNLGAQLPLLLRGCYYEGWKPSRKPGEDRTKEQFLSHVARELRGDRRLEDFEEIVSTVFATLERHVTAGEIEDVKSNLPAELRALWPSHAAREEITGP
jgi:uncharacterized protein (DUF2267 family)